MYPCCKKLIHPLIFIVGADSTVKAGFLEYQEDYLELKGQFSLDVLHGKILRDYLRHTFHKERCIKHVAITRPVIQAILGEVTRRLFLLYLAVTDLDNHVGFSAVQKRL